MREFIFTTEQELEIINKKNSGEKVSNIAQEYGIQKHLVYQILKRNGREKVIANKKYEVDENYFENIDTEEKAYWLGFLYADGYVRMIKYKSGADRYGELKLKLSIKDKKHLDLFKKCVGSSYTIKDAESITINNGKHSYSVCSTLRITNIKIVKDLFKHGCINKKTYKLNFPILAENLIRHFIRGYFDGDGSISITKFKAYQNKKGKINNGYTRTVNFTSGSLSFLMDIQNILHTKINTTNLKVGLYKKAYRIHWYSRNDINNVYNYLYKDSTIFLERKKEKFIEIFNSYVK